MTRLSRSRLFSLWVISALLFVLVGVQPAQAAGKTVLVLPFAVQAGPELPDGPRVVPQTIVEKLAARGFRPVAMQRANSLFQASGLKSIDLAAARELGVQAGADLVIYGAFTQKDRGFTMDTRLVPVSGASPVPARFERPSMSDFAEATTQLAARAEVALNPVQAQPAAAPDPAPAPERPASPQAALPTCRCAASGTWTRKSCSCA